MDKPINLSIGLIGLIGCFETVNTHRLLTLRRSHPINSLQNYQRPAAAPARCGLEMSKNEGCCCVRRVRRRSIPPCLRNSVGTPLSAGPSVRTCSGRLGVVPRALLRPRGVRATRGRVPVCERPVRRPCIPCCRVTHRSGRSNAPPFVGVFAGRVVVCHLSATAVHHSALPSPPNRRRWRHRLRV